MCPDVEVGATEVDPEAPTSAPHQTSIPIGVTGDIATSIHTSDTESIVSREGHSDFEGDQDPVPISDPPFPPVFEWLASVDVQSLFAKRACLMKPVPGFMKGSYWSAMRIALADIDEGRSHQPFCTPPVVGSCSCCCQGCCSTDLPEGARFRKHSCNGRCSIGTRDRRNVGHVAEPVEVPPPQSGIRSLKTFWKWSQEVPLCLIQNCLPATFEVRDAELQQAPQA